MTGESLDELYFQWLYRQVANHRSDNPASRSESLLRALHNRKFEWSVPNDDNREADGKYLRYSFFEAMGEDPDNYARWLLHDCSMLEMLVALSRRLSFMAGRPPRTWFWQMINNLGINFRDNRFGRMQQDAINQALDQVIYRTYRADGVGGLFPARRPVQDQRKVELWYQMNHYLIERG